MNSAVEFQNLSRRIGKKPVLSDVTLRLEPGTVTGLIGENGAGKTTLIKHALGLLVPDAGTVRVFGLDPVREPVPVLARIGYMSEEDTLPGWMRIHQLQRYFQGFYHTWDQAYADQLCLDFKLGPNDRLALLSKGQRARAALMSVLAYRPELLILDEPSSGLDPLVRRDILGAVVRLIAEEGRTVLFSSHLLAEVDRVADQIAMIRDGRILFATEIDELKDTHHMVTLGFDRQRPVAPKLEGAVFWEQSGRTWTALVRADLGDVECAASAVGSATVDIRPASLEEVFIGYSKGTILEEVTGGATK